MTAPLRINEALLIADRAFKPFQCVAWAQQDGNGEKLCITVIDRTNTHLSVTPRSRAVPIAGPGTTRTPASAGPEAELSQDGYQLQSWSMPH